MHRLVTLLLAALALTMVPASAHAHAVGLEWRFRDDRVVIGVFYDDDSPAVRAKVRVLDGDDREIESGLTDEKGGWSFARPAPGRYTIDVDAGAGHTVRETIAVAQAGTAQTSEDVNDGQRRDKFTRFPWVGLLLGLLIIAGLAGAFVLVAAFRKGIRGK